MTRTRATKGYVEEVARLGMSIDDFHERMNKSISEEAKAVYTDSIKAEMPRW